MLKRMEKPRDIGTWVYSFNGSHPVFTKTVKYLDVVRMAKRDAADKGKLVAFILGQIAFLLFFQYTIFILDYFTPLKNIIENYILLESITYDTFFNNA